MEVFVRLTVLPLQCFEVTYPVFDDVPNTIIPDAFHHLVPDDYFHCQRPLKTPNLTYLAVKSVSCQMWLRTEIGYYCNSPTGYDGMHFPAILTLLQRHDSVRLSSVYTDYSFSTLTFITVIPLCKGDGELLHNCIYTVIHKMWQYICDRNSGKLV